GPQAAIEVRLIAGAPAGDVDLSKENGVAGAVLDGVEFEGAVGPAQARGTEDIVVGANRAAGPAIGSAVGGVAQAVVVGGVGGAEQQLDSLVILATGIAAGSQQVEDGPLLDVGQQESDPGVIEAAVPGRPGQERGRIVSAQGREGFAVVVQVVDGEANLFHV